MCFFDALNPAACEDYSHLEECRNMGCPRAFKCALSYCIPIRCVCNGKVDCRYGDDEASCDQYVCDNLLQCRGSNVCIPPWEVCDGIVHCSHFQEDEVYCEECPAGLSCHGRAIECLQRPQAFPTPSQSFKMSQYLVFH